MNHVPAVLSIAILLLAAWVLLGNWVCMILTIRNKRRGIDRHHSTVPALSFVLLLLAQYIYPHLSTGLLLIIPMVDVGNWVLLWGLFYHFIRQRKKRVNL
jgi:hypothetical protein